MCSFINYNVTMHKLNNWLITVSFILLIISCSKRNDFSTTLKTEPELQQEPLQKLTTEPAFSTTYNDELFEIIPKFEYELYGLVVSYRLHDSEHGQMLHALSKDHLNVADYCVVWGQSADPNILREFDFSNGQFTCNYSTKSNEAWQAFDPKQLSNNHLLAIDDAVRTSIDQISIGDQIYIKGWLAHYKTNGGSERGTSITRNDTGNGACETILVNEITLLAKMPSIWRQMMWISLGLFILTLYIYFKSPYEPHNNA